MLTALIERDALSFSTIMKRLRRLRKEMLVRETVAGTPALAKSHCCSFKKRSNGKTAKMTECVDFRFIKHWQRASYLNKAVTDNGLITTSQDYFVFEEPLLLYSTIHLGV